MSDSEISGSDDGARVLAMPIVVRMERNADLLRSEVLEAAAAATLRCWVQLGDDKRFADLFDEWLAGRFRKVTRRARAKQWDDVCALPGVTVTVGSASVRAFPPQPKADTPSAIAKLQVSGTDIPADLPPEPASDRVTLWLNPDLSMSVGKACAQVGHAAMLTYMSLSPLAQAAWEAAGFELAVRYPSSSSWVSLERSAASGDLVSVVDAGFTEVAHGSRTVVVTF